jgi:hypothetical protein
MIMYYKAEVELNELVGKVIKSITGLEKYSDEVRIFTECGQEYMFYHEQDCCENVDLNDYEGEAVDLTGGLITSAEIAEGDHDKEPEYAESFTWSFYKIETSKGGLWMRWLGESNGYYGEEVNFVWVNKPDLV